MTHSTPPALRQPVVSALLDWFDANARDLPWRRTNDPYAVYISEIMLQQTQVKTVIPYWERWMRAMPNVKSLAEADPQTVLKLWEGLGYYSRARNAQAAARIIVDEFGGQFPSAFDAMQQLPGVGRYTAGAVCSIAFNQPVPVLDGNVARVLCRLFAIGGDVKSKPVNARLWKLAAQLVETAFEMPDRRLAGVCDCLLQIAENFSSSQFVKRTKNGVAGNCSRINQSLMELGALVCTPKNPACDQCPVVQFCRAQQMNRVDEFPKPSERHSATRRRFAAFLVSKQQKYLVRQRPEGGVNALLWEFPNIELKPDDSLTDSTTAPFRITADKPMLRVTHSITRYRITLEVYPADLRPRARTPGSWVSIDELKKLPFTGAHRKIAALLKRTATPKPD